ncbi:hypothetical protein N0V94_006133 [Neodidymelliopsis sp. IMI 364377]|nr:hypothetical protein N0V94_006133 [Neodidymelliopsis sp. IMI 364377]
MVVLSAILAACISLVLLFEPITAVVIPGPDQLHPFDVAIAHQDYNAPKLGSKLTASLFMPVKKADCIAHCEKLYMPAGTARASNEQFLGNASIGVFERMRYKTCCGGSQVIDASKYPLVFLEPQVDTSRFLYSTLARFMSANGMAVVLIDHPHDSPISQDVSHGSSDARDNNPVNLNPFGAITTWNETVTKAIDTRIQGINFMLQELAEVSSLKRQFSAFKFKSTLDTSFYTVVGHGIGGTTATTLSALDPRVRFSINLSGSAPLLQHYTSADIYFFGRSDFRRENDIHWPATWKQLVGRATEWDLRDAGIFDYSDLPWIVDLARKNEKMTIKHVEGLQSLGPWGFHITACFLEGYLRAQLAEPKDIYAISKCVGMFPEMVPYPGVGS